MIAVWARPALGSPLHMAVETSAASSEPVARAVTEGLTSGVVVRRAVAAAIKAPDRRCHVAARERLAAACARATFSWRRRHRDGWGGLAAARRLFLEVVFGDVVVRFSARIVVAVVGVVAVDGVAEVEGGWAGGPTVPD